MAFLTRLKLRVGNLEWKREAWLQAQLCCPHPRVFRTFLHSRFQPSTPSPSSNPPPQAPRPAPWSPRPYVSSLLLFILLGEKEREKEATRLPTFSTSPYLWEGPRVEVGLTMHLEPSLHRHSKNVCCSPKPASGCHKTHNGQGGRASTAVELKPRVAALTNFLPALNSLPTSPTTDPGKLLS